VNAEQEMRRQAEKASKEAADRASREAAVKAAKKIAGKAIKVILPFGIGLIYNLIISPARLKRKESGVRLLMPYLTTSPLSQPSRAFWELITGIDVVPDQKEWEVMSGEMAPSKLAATTISDPKTTTSGKAGRFPA
jgi:hypothetical protein